MSKGVGLNTFLLLAFLSLHSLGVAQLDSLGTGHDTILNSHELQFMDSLFVFPDTQMNFKELNIVYVGTDKEHPIMTKKAFFNQFILPYSSEGELPPLQWKGLSKEEQIRANGAQALMMPLSSNTVSNKTVFKLLRKQAKGK